MIFFTQHQLNTLLIFSFWGFIVGFFISLSTLIFLLNFQKKYIKLMFFCVFYSFFSIFFVFLINFYNLGMFSFSLLLSFILCAIWVKTLLNKTLVILEKKWYTKVNNKLKHFSNKFKNHKKRETNEPTKES